MHYKLEKFDWKNQKPGFFPKYTLAWLNFINQCLYDADRETLRYEGKFDEFVSTQLKKYNAYNEKNEVWFNSRDSLTLFILRWS